MSDQDQVAVVPENTESVSGPVENPAPPAETKVPLSWAVVPLGQEDFWQLQEIGLYSDGTYKILRKGVPNTKAVCTARAIYGLEGFDPFDTGTVE